MAIPEDFPRPSAGIVGPPTGGPGGRSVRPSGDRSVAGPLARLPDGQGAGCSLGRVDERPKVTREKAPTEQSPETRNLPNTYYRLITSAASFREFKATSCSWLPPSVVSAVVHTVSAALLTTQFASLSPRARQVYICFLLQHQHEIVSSHSDSVHVLRSTDSSSVCRWLNPESV